MNDVPLESLLAALFSAALIAAVPLTLAALGEAVAEQAGLLNLGIEGMMLSGAFFGFAVAFELDRPVVGLAAGLAVGLAFGLLFGVLAVGLRVDQVLLGLAITIFATGLTGFLYRDFYGRENPSLDERLGAVRVPLLSEIPIIGQGLFNQAWPVYLTWALVVVFAFLLRRTRFGLNVRAVGETPFAADAAGIDVARVRYLAIAIGGAMAGLGGAFLSVVDIHTFQPGMTVGRGFIALAITMLGAWRPGRILAGAILFGALGSLDTALQILEVDVQSEFTTMLPYVGIMVALVVLAGRTALPSALAVPYERGRR
jgi:simple sugar transport system permease protein